MGLFCVCGGGYFFFFKEGMKLGAWRDGEGWEAFGEGESTVRYVV